MKVIIGFRVAFCYTSAQGLQVKLFSVSLLEEKLFLCEMFSQSSQSHRNGVTWFAPLETIGKIYVSCLITNTAVKSRNEARDAVPFWRGQLLATSPCRPFGLIFLAGFKAATSSGGLLFREAAWPSTGCCWMPSDRRSSCGPLNSSIGISSGGSRPGLHLSVSFLAALHHLCLQARKTVNMARTARTNASSARTEKHQKTTHLALHTARTCLLQNISNAVVAEATSYRRYSRLARARHDSEKQNFLTNSGKFASLAKQSVDTEVSVAWTAHAWGAALVERSTAAQASTVSLNWWRNGSKFLADHAHGQVQGTANAYGGRAMGTWHGLTLDSKSLRDLRQCIPTFFPLATHFCWQFFVFAVKSQSANFQWMFQLNIGKLTFNPRKNFTARWLRSFDLNNATPNQTNHESNNRVSTQFLI